MSSSVEAVRASAVDGRAELVFARRDGRTTLTHSLVTAPMTLIRTFPLPDGRQLVPLITLGPGLCGGDVVRLRIVAEEGAGVVVTTTAATRVLSMEPGAHAEQHVEIEAAPGARVGVMETWALGRTARGEYLDFRSLSNRTTLHVDGRLAYADATELNPETHPLAGAGILAGRRYLAAGFWYGATLADEPQDGAAGGDLLMAAGQSRPDVAFVRALASDAPALDARLGRLTARIAAAWGQDPVPLDRFRC